MFVHMKKLSAHSADALDLIIEFATLGEYGLECPGPDSVTRANPCHEGRHRTGATPIRRTRVVESGLSTPPDAKPFSETVSRRRERASQTACSTESSDFASALRPPRIKLSFTD